MLPPLLLLLLLLLPHISHAQRTPPDGLHLPIYQRRLAPLERRAGAAGSIGLGNFQDITYNVLVKVGDTEVPLVLDTGSSDLWVISDACRDPSCAAGGIPLYPQASFQSAGIDAKLFYGDSQTGTHAFGEIGKDIAGVAGLSIQDQFFAAINDTNTTVSQTGSSGIFGLGFPVNSVIWDHLFRAQFPTGPQPPTKRANTRTTPSSRLHSLLTGRSTRRHAAHALLPLFPDARRTQFPDLASLLPPRAPTKRQTPPPPSLPDLLATFATNGPLLARLAAQSALAAPQFTITLQRDAIQVGGNPGTLSLGALPAGVANASLTWVPLRGYTPAQGGLASPTDTYPIAWEVALDAVYVDGARLPPPRLAPGVAVSALIDTGNSLIRGPRDVVQALAAAVGAGAGAGAGAGTFPCAVPHTLAFEIGGALFPVDPRDFIQPVQRSGARACVPNVVATDPPRDGFLYSWSLGDPFLKSTLVSFYFGNLTHPSADPPRMGFLSTVQRDAAAQLGAAAAAAAAAGSFPAQTEAAPSAAAGAGGTTVGGGAAPVATAAGAGAGAVRGASSGARARAGAGGVAVAAAAVAAWLCGVS